MVVGVSVVVVMCVVVVVERGGVVVVVVFPGASVVVAAAVALAADVAVVSLGSDSEEPQAAIASTRSMIGTKMPRHK